MGATGRVTLAPWALPGAVGLLVLIPSVAYMVSVPSLAGRKLQSFLLVPMALPSKPSTELIVAPEVGQVFLSVTGTVQNRYKQSGPPQEDQVPLVSKSDMTKDVFFCSFSGSWTTSVC